MFSENFEIIRSFQGHQVCKFFLAYLQHGDYNIISVDYHPLAPEPCYFQAVQNLPVVAKCTAQLLDHMIATEKISLDDIHVIGFSLGAQTAGMMANYIKSGKLKRITGTMHGMN